MLAPTPRLLLLVTLAALAARPAAGGPIHDAATNGDLDALRRIVDRDASQLTAVDDKERSAVRCAAIAGQRDAVLFLLDRSGDASQANGAACAAADNGHLELLEALFKRGVSPEVRNDNQTTLLMLAASSNHVDVCRTLLERGLDPRVAKGDGRTALHYAAQYGAPDTARLLLELGVAADPLTERGWSPLHYAAREGYPEVIEVLMERGGAAVGRSTKVQQEAGKPPVGGHTPLHLAATGNHTGCLRALLAGNAEIDAINVQHFTPLSMAVVKRKKEAVAFLLEQGADPEIRDYERETALLNACRVSDLAIISLLLKHGVNLDARNFEEYTPAGIAVGKRNSEMLRLLVEAGASPGASSQGVSALQFAIRENDEPLVRLLLEKGADPSAAGNFGCPALSEAAYAGSLSMVKRIIESGADVREVAPVYQNQRPVEGQYYTPAWGAAFANNLPMLRYLAEQGAELDLVSKGGLTPLQVAANNGNLPMMRLLVEGGASIEGRGDGSPMLQAVANGHGHAVGFLLDNGANPNGVDETTGHSWLYTAAADGSADVVDRLLSAGADPRVQIDGVTPFLRAVVNGNADVVRTMMGHGVDASSEGNGGRAILMTSVMSGNAEVVDLIIERGSGRRALEMRTSDGRTALILAAVRGDLETVKVLVAAGANVNTTANVDQVPSLDGQDIRPEERDKTAVQIIQWHLRQNYGVMTPEYDRNFDREEVAEYLRAHGAR